MTRELSVHIIYAPIHIRSSQQTEQETTHNNTVQTRVTVPATM